MNNTQFEYNPLVTVIIPVYNGINFIHEAIDCAIEQTYSPLEIVVINDGSTDEGATEAVALSYGDKIRYISKPNGGVSSALNMAIEASNGEYFSWLSHDDLYYPDKIEKEVAFLNRIITEESDIDPKKVVIHCATESIDKNGRVIKVPDYHGVDERETNIKVILDNVYCYRLSGCSFLLPKAAYYDVGGFREDIHTVSDVEYWYRLLFRDYHFYCLTRERLVKNRSHGKQVGKTKVNLFEKELNELHISIARQLMDKAEYNTPQIMERYYFGLVKRGMKQAADFVKHEALDDKISCFKAKCVLPIKRFIWSAKGITVNVLRVVYRKIFVK